MHRRLAVVGVLLMVITACGDGGGDDRGQVTTSRDADSATTTVAGGSGPGANGGEVVNRQDPGTAAVSVDGQDFSFDTVGPVGCSVSDSEFNVGFILGDNDVSFVAGGTASGSEWRGRIDVNVQSGEGITNYFADFAGGDGGTIAVDGSSFSYSGPWDVFRPGASEAESAGQGTLSATCG